MSSELAAPAESAHAVAVNLIDLLLQMTMRGARSATVAAICREVDQLAGSDQVPPAQRAAAQRLRRQWFEFLAELQLHHAPCASPYRH